MNSIWAIPCVLLIRTIKPILHIRICALHAARIGHIVPDVAEHLLINKSRPQRVLYLYFFLPPISNYQWFRMARRSSLRIFHGWLWYPYYWNRLIPGGGSHELPSSLNDSRDVAGLLNEFDISLPFTDEEDRKCNAWLKSKGWREGEPFVVLNVRDSQYLSQWIPDTDFDYHSYRNSSIEEYLLAVEWLNNQGVWVLRMGRNMAQPLHSNSDMTIDYAFEEEKSDLLDIWLFANCSACITTASGPDLVSAIYKQPLLCVNASPLGILFSMFESIWVPKNLYWENSGLSLSLKEYLDHTFLRTDDYLKAGIRIVDLTSDEILAAVKEFWGRIDGSWKESPNDINLQREFWEKFYQWPEYYAYHDWKHPFSRVGNAWLASKGPKFLFPNWVK